jgi:uncharacterized protein YjdB
MIFMKTIIFTFLFCLGNLWGFSQKNAAIFLHHSTGDGVYTKGNVSNWVTNYNSSHETNFRIIPRTYPNTPYPWENYPYDYWNLWVNNSCNNSNPNTECLSSIANNYGLVIFKHCFPGASINPDTGTPNITSERKSLENYKLQYRALRTLMDGMPDKKFMVWTLVPLHRLATTTEEATRAYEFVKWVKNQWLTEDGKLHANIFIFDFYSLAAEMNEKPTNGKQFCLKYEYEGSHTSNDSHPNTLANQTIGPLFAKAVVDVLTTNYYITNISVHSLSGENKIAAYHGTLQMGTSILPADALSKSVIWSVVNLTGEASVNSTGLITAKTNGTVKIIATANDGSGVFGELIVTITNQIIPVESITISPPSGTAITKDKGSMQMNAAILPDHATNKSVSWSVVNETGKASISTSGLLTAEKDGTVKVIASANDGSGVKGNVFVTISNQQILVETISIIDNLAKDTINGIGTKLTLSTSIIPLNATNQNVTWSIENITGKASIDSWGLLTTVAPGIIDVVAKTNDGSNVFCHKQYTIAISNDSHILNKTIHPIIYTNSPNGTIQINLDEIPAEGVLLSIRNILGQKILEQWITNKITVLTHRQMPDQIVLITITTKNAVFTRKIFFK